MNSCETLDLIRHHFKKKICILGGTEKYKDEFQKKISSNCLPIENKQNIGVNISRIDYLYEKANKFEFLLWNIDCGRQRAFLRTIFYNGAEAIIIFISEMKINQIIQYFNEVHQKLNPATIIFCVILENLTTEEIMKIYFENEGFYSILENNSIKIEEITDPFKILNQICSTFIKKTMNKEIETNYIIDIIPLNLLLENNNISDTCGDYFEPETNHFYINKAINTELLIRYILKLNLDVELEAVNWIRVINEKFGIFSIFLKNGNVYFVPKGCISCKFKNCEKKKKAPFFICIEAETDGSVGWTNINGFSQNELLILSKIIALKEGDENTLPRSIIKQIKRISICEKITK